MKYTIASVDQRAALALGDVDITDCHLLGWLFHFCNSKSEKLERNQHGTWVNYEFLAADMPLLGLERNSVGRRLRELQEKGYLKLYTNKGIRKTYIDLTEKVERLFGDEPTHQNHLAPSQRMQITRPTHPDHLAQGRAKLSGSPHQSYYDHSNKDQGKTDEKSAPRPLDIRRFDEPVPQRDGPSPVAGRILETIKTKGVRALKGNTDILRHSQPDGANSVEPHTDTEMAGKPVKQAVKTARSAAATPHASKQLATAQT